MERRYGWEELKELKEYGKTADAVFTLKEMNAAFNRATKGKEKPDLIIIYNRETWIFLSCGSNGTQKEKNKAGRIWDEMHGILTEKTRGKRDA